MPEEPQELAANEWGTITYYPQWNTLELTWSPDTRSMGDDGFKQTLQLLADHGLKVRPRFMIIDATPAVPGTVEKGGAPAPDGPAAFPTGWFETRDRMYAWLTS